ncbi:hypothetical protein Syncc8109_1996 [Synechococcus sp. WH 8109]|uniref:WbuC family cupin fold metalloprotein n=1 Tax=Synechococcus sp. WH 8109 TaxID=166314 RepID=UPI0001B8DBDA|nr:WbuC family cupin fold metalloprotein [Synechococcus sp. WH 8109]AHF64340.1 hypothetical protein Syncc8109_1996 [Synechococcus sp. WH 8109]
MRLHSHQQNGPGTGFEFFLMLQGTIGLLLFNSEGDIQQQLHHSAKGPTHGIEIAKGRSSTPVALEADSVIFELKQGPYQPSQDEDFFNFFPKVGTT